MVGAFWPLCIFAAAWGMGALKAAGLPSSTFVGPAVLSGIILALAYRRFGRGGRTQLEQKRVWRIVALWSLVEVALIVLAAWALGASGHAALAGPAFVAIIGLHFLPLAHYLPFRLYWWTGAAMILIGLIGCAPGVHLAAIYAGAAGALWLTSGRMLGVRRVG